jgi:predicted deacetylase
MATDKPRATAQAKRVPILTSSQIIKICMLADNQARENATFYTRQEAAFREAIPVRVQRLRVDRAKQRLFDYLKDL